MQNKIDLFSEVLIDSMVRSLVGSAEKIDDDKYKNDLNEYDMLLVLQKNAVSWEIMQLLLHFSEKPTA